LAKQKRADKKYKRKMKEREVKDWNNKTCILE
jgi:hypothetical protein